MALAIKSAAGACMASDCKLKLKDVMGTGTSSMLTNLAFTTVTGFPVPIDINTILGYSSIDAGVPVKVQLPVDISQRLAPPPPPPPGATVTPLGAPLPLSQADNLRAQKQNRRSASLLPESDCAACLIIEAAYYRSV